MSPAEKQILFRGPVVPEVVSVVIRATSDCGIARKASASFAKSAGVVK